METVLPTQAPIEWPTISVGSGKEKREFTLRMSYAANYQLTRWGVNTAKATAIELAAAMAGQFVDGKWRSEAFARPQDLADLMEPTDEQGLLEAVLAALVKASPEAVVSLQPVPAKETPEAETATETPAQS
jgi:hypothetical protein